MSELSNQAKLFEVKIRQPGSSMLSCRDESFSPSGDRLSADDRHADDELLVLFADRDECEEESSENSVIHVHDVTPFSHDSVNDYRAKIGRLSLLSAEDEVRLGKAIEAGLYAEYLLNQHDDRFNTTELRVLVEEGKQAHERMILGNVRLVVAIAWRYLGKGLPLADLIQEGNIGLMHAVEKFDYTLGYKFSTYATWWIRQAITRSLGDQGSLIRMPIHFVDKVKAVDVIRRQEAMTWLEFCRSRPEGIPEVEVSASQLRLMEMLKTSILSCEELVEKEADDLVEDLLTMGVRDDVDNIVERHSHQRESERFLSFIRWINPRDEAVVRYRFGFMTGEEETLEQVGQRFGLTRERIRQIVARSIEQCQLVKDVPPGREQGEWQRIQKARKLGKGKGKRTRDSSWRGRLTSRQAGRGEHMMPWTNGIGGVGIDEARDTDFDVVSVELVLLPPRGYYATTDDGSSYRPRRILAS